ncbi:hypothetical protein [Streptomyces sp. SID8499]|uniref:hypothetical protein n=1 Tax=Streptomyces sp. SID8499 TaxID=2706106 RepID=UPI0013CB4DE1|nr:hypothetical protein [Streptomyces sp. SID8499]NED31976.1 hypothetical protein [Streptomyces sp. SID8499]
MSARLVRRPTENIALRATRRPVYRLPAVLADMTTANRLRDREGMLLLACRAVRATNKEVGE